MDEKLISKDIKFVITFDELISLIRYSLESQIKINEHSKDETDYLKTLSQDFINDITHYIYSYEKVEKIEKPLSKNKDTSNSNKENINVNGNNKKNKKSLCSIISKSPSYWAESQKTRNNKNKVINEEKSTLNNRANKNKNNFESKNSYRRTVVHKLFSPKNEDKFKNKFPKNDNKSKKVLNRSAAKRYTSILSDTSNNNKKKKINKSGEKRKSVIMDKTKKNENKNLSIFTACETLKSSSFILKNRNNSFFSTEHYDKNDNKKNANNYNSNINLNDKNCKSHYNISVNKKSDTKIVYYDQNLNLNVKKQIIMGNVFKPSTFANKLLQNGMKYITEFNGLKEEEKKKQLY
jgi:hypothetical protein